MDNKKVIEDNLENNVLIANFMGYKVEQFMSNPPRPTGACARFANGDGSLVLEAMLFHMSWDWLMPVCEKISSLDKVEIFIGMIGVIKNAHIPYEAGISYRVSEGGKTLVTRGRVLIECVYDSVVRFIKIYNEANRGK